jgi:hypothetical protein
MEMKMKKLIIAALAIPLLAGVAVAGEGKAKLEKGNVLLSGGLSKNDFPRLSFPALKLSLKSGWGLCLPITMLKDGGVFVIDAGMVSRLAASNDAVSNLPTDTLKGLNVNVNTGGEFDDLDMEFYPPSELKKIVPFIKEAKGTVMLRFTNGIGSTEVTSAQIKKVLTSLFGETLPSHVVLASSHENMLIDLRAQMPKARIVRFARPWNDKYGRFLGWGWPAPLSKSLKKHNFEGVIIAWLPGYTDDVNYHKKLKSLGVKTGCYVTSSDFTTKFILDAELDFPVINNVSSVSKMFKDK